MIFTDLPGGASVFVDANTLLYHFTADANYGAACTELLERVERQELVGFTSTHVVSEVAHRLMTIEAALRFNRTFAGIAPWLKKHPGQVQQLIRFRQAIQEVPRYRLQILTIPADLLDPAAEISQQTGLLHNDALIVALLRLHGLSNLASADADFDPVPALTRYSPA